MQITTIQYTSIPDTFEPYFQTENQWGLFDAKGVLVGVSVDERLTKHIAEGTPEQFFETYRDGTVRKLEATPQNSLDARGYRFLHAVLGLMDEVGELAKMLKAHLWYGKAFDVQNVGEEAGDLEWYLTLLHDSVGLSQIETMQANARKLRARYSDSFSTERALTRDLDKERQALEGED